MDPKVIEEMKQDQRIDDLDHKTQVYDDVKSTLRLCETMIKALDATDDKEYGSRMNLLNNLEIARSYALLGAADCEIEKEGLTK